MTCCNGCSGMGALPFAPSDPTDAGGWWSWLQERARDFVELVPRIYDLAHEAAVEAATARARGDLEGWQEGRAAVERIMALWRQASSLLPTVERVANAGGLAGPWIAAGIAAGTVVAVGAAVAWVFARYGAESQIVALLRNGELTAEEAAAILESTGRPPGGFLSSVVGLLAVGAVVLAVRGRR